MKKVYEAHELAYTNLKNHGAVSWNEKYSTEKGKEPDHIGKERQRFIENLLEKEWFPKTGKALEIGCGTGHFTRWISSKGFFCSGIDISSTAVGMAKEQSKGSNIEFFNGDYCYSNIFKPASFDMIADGHCFHCIVEDSDRKTFLEKSKSLLKKDGILTLLTICSPVNKKNFSKKYPANKYRNNILYVPFNEDLEGSKVFNGIKYMSQRKIDHWKDILKLLETSGFEIKCFEFERGEIFSRIYIAAKIK